MYCLVMSVLVCIAVVFSGVRVGRYFSLWSRPLLFYVFISVT